MTAASFDGHAVTSTRRVRRSYWDHAGTAWWVHRRQAPFARRLTLEEIALMDSRPVLAALGRRRRLVAV